MSLVLNHGSCSGCGTQGRRCDCNAKKRAVVNEWLKGLTANRVEVDEVGDAMTNNVAGGYAIAENALRYGQAVPADHDVSWLEGVQLNAEGREMVANYAGYAQCEATDEMVARAERMDRFDSIGGGYDVDPRWMMEQ